MLRVIGIVVSTILALNAFATDSFFAGILATLIAVGLFWSRVKSRKKHMEKVADDEFQPILIEGMEDTTEYFEYMEALQEAERRNDFKTMFLYVEKTIPILPKFVDGSKKAYGDFGISTIPAIDAACRYWAVLGEREKLNQLKAILNGKEELQDWTPCVEAALNDADLADRIQTHLRDNPGFPQNEMGKVLAVSGRDTARIINTQEKLGMLRRQSEGKTYKLYLTAI